MGKARRRARPHSRSSSRANRTARAISATKCNFDLGSKETGGEHALHVYPRAARMGASEICGSLLRLGSISMIRITLLSILVAIAAPALARADQDKEAQCVAKAQASTDPPGSALATIILGENSKGREFLRLSWAASGVGGPHYKTFSCYFENGALTAWGHERPQVMGL